MPFFLQENSTHSLFFTFGLSRSYPIPSMGLVWNIYLHLVDFDGKCR